MGDPRLGKRRVLVLVSSAGGGDRPPVLALAIDLRTRGHDVLLVCDAGMERLAASTGLGHATHDIAQAGYISRWIRDLDDGPPNPLIVWGADAMSDVRAIAASFNPDSIVSALFTMGLAELLAAEMGIPWCFVNPSFYFGDGSASTWEEDWHGPLVPRLARECFAPLVEAADLVLHATDPGFDFEPRALPASHHYVGFLFWEPTMPRPTYLDHLGAPWVLVTASSARPSDEAAMLTAALEALDGRDVRALVTQPARSYELPRTSNAVVEGFVPHLAVLEHSSMSINHAGHGIVSKCIALGVPMVLLPWDADQPGVAARAASHGVAAVVRREAVTSESVRSAVESVLEDARVRTAARELAASVAARRRPQFAASLIEAM